MTPGRIPCINPNCRRTAAQDKYPGSDSIICGKCWRALPASRRARWKALKARDRHLSQLYRKTRFQDVLRRAQWSKIADQFDRAWDRLIASIVHYYTTCEQPISIEDFLKENGLG